jgi:hypothetical protein
VSSPEIVVQVSGSREQEVLADIVCGAGSLTFSFLYPFISCVFVGKLSAVASLNPLGLTPQLIADEMLTLSSSRGPFPTSVYVNSAPPGRRHRHGSANPPVHRPGSEPSVAQVRGRGLQTG